MAEPSSKRTRRPDSASMWDGDDNKRPAGGRGAGRDGGRRDGGRYRSRSRDRHDTRNGGGRRDTSANRDRPTRRRGEDRARSRSPRTADGRDGTRRRSPPRGPRSSQPNGHHNSKPAPAPAPAPVPATTGLALAGGPTQPSSAEWDRRVRSRKANAMDTDDADLDPEEVELARVMGFGGFRSTKNTKVPGNSLNFGIRKEKKTEYRQYMNRVGGFNRPLSPSRS